MPSVLPDQLVATSAYPLGAHCDGEGTRFAVFAGGAERVDLCLFDANGQPQCSLSMPECTHGVWHGFAPGVGAGQQYGYRAYGPYRPDEGLRYNPHKLLLDPYAQALAGELRWHDALYGYRISSPRGDLSFDRRDSAPYMPKAVVCTDRFDWGDDRAPRTPWSDTVIYEAHLRGLTRRSAEIPERVRGTAAGLADPHTIQTLQRLGISAVELLPVHALIPDRPLVERGLINYWGYNTLGFFAPEPRYLASGQVDEFKSAVKALHAAGIEVILDVVYNHTCEGSELGPTLSLRGLDNVAYYRLVADQPRHCINDTGCGNTTNFSHPRMIQLTLDSLRHWVQVYHVDGFRFDLSVTLGRESNGFDPHAGFFDALMQDPLLSQVKLIAEPWDLGPGGYQLGNHPAGMAEWNAKYRDEVRKFWRGDAGLRGALAGRIQGSADIFDYNHRKPWASINFITAHDGFTLQDWVSYQQKHNEANGENNRDGADDNESNNWGVEGPSEEPAILERRARVRRAMLSTLLFSHGTPMLLGGDEFARTQQGNNNAYCQDSELSWFDWTAAQSPEALVQREFVARLLRLRRELASLRCGYFQHGQLEPVAEVRDIEWFDESGDAMRQEDWQYWEGRLLTLRRAVRLDAERAEVTLLLMNSTLDQHAFQLPQPLLPWRLRIDSVDPTAEERDVDTPAIHVGPQGVVLLSVVIAAPTPASLMHGAHDQLLQPQRAMPPPPAATAAAAASTVLDNEVI